jgi:hypothetical protein
MAANGIGRVGRPFLPRTRDVGGSGQGFFDLPEPPEEPLAAPPDAGAVVVEDCDVFTFPGAGFEDEAVGVVAVVVLLVAFDVDPARVDGLERSTLLEGAGRARVPARPMA